jgi:dolichyl-phosphate-mannose--protein O-mannosyl transferase
MRQYKPKSRELLRGAVALGVILIVLEIGYRVGMGWLGGVVLIGIVAVVELYRLVQRQRGLSR